MTEAIDMLLNPKARQVPAFGSVIRKLGSLDGADLLAPLIKYGFPGRIALVSSFGSESAVLLHMIAEIDRATPVITLDTEKLFAETVDYRSNLIDRLGLTDVRIVQPDANSIRQLDAEGLLHLGNPDLCCRIRKVEPLNHALVGFDAWISGRKRFHGALRANIPTLQVLDGRLKVEPLARFTATDIETYFNRHDLPRHPLVGQGYRSIGCMPCTVKGGTADTPRAGRWAGLAKTECGIHWSVGGKQTEPVRCGPDRS